MSRLDVDEWILLGPCGEMDSAFHSYFVWKNLYSADGARNAATCNSKTLLPLEFELYDFAVTLNGLDC